MNSVYKWKSESERYIICDVSVFVIFEHSTMCNVCILMVWKLHFSLSDSHINHHHHHHQNKNTTTTTNNKNANNPPAKKQQQQQQI